MQLAITIDAMRRQRIANGLSHILADTHGLRLQTRESEQRVEGPMSSALRAMLVEVHDELCAAEVELAAGVRSLGGAARAASGEHLRADSAGSEGRGQTIDDALGRLVERHERIARSATSTLKLAEAACDRQTCELLARRIEAHSKSAWMLALAGAAFLIARELPPGS